jgi:hypothetical protein
MRSYSRSQPLYPHGKNPRIPHNRHQGVTQRQSGSFRDEKSLALPENLTLDRLVYYYIVYIGGHL